MNPLGDTLSAKTVKSKQNTTDQFQIAFHGFEDCEHYVWAKKSEPFFQSWYTRAQVNLDDSVTTLWIYSSDIMKYFAKRLHEIETVLSRFPKQMAALLKDRVRCCTKQIISEDTLFRTIEIASRYFDEETVKCYKGQAIRTLIAGQKRFYALFTKRQAHQDQILGGGATKRAKLALNLKTAEVHALLICRKDYLANPLLEWGQIIDEVDLLKELRDSPGVLKLYDAVVTDEKIYMITELFNQGDLEKIFITHANLDTEDKITIASQITLGLWNMHHKQILHRDLKPSNILITIAPNHIKSVIGDLGNACRRNQRDRLQTQTGSIAYMAPEKIKSLKTKDWISSSTPEADVWSLGLVLQSLFNKKMGTLMSFQMAKNVEDAIESLTDEAVNAELDRSQIPEPILSVLKQMLQIDPAKRMNPKQIYAAFGKAHIELEVNAPGIRGQ